MKLESLSPKPLHRSVSTADDELLHLSKSTEEVDDSVEDLKLDEQERLILEEENKLLQNKLETNVDQARKIEKKVMEISELQQVFALKVAEQIELIDHNYQSVLQAHANVERGNRELQQATRRGVDFRVCVLLFIIVAGFSLLFLDWIS
jgi:syntaxin 18